MDLALLKEGFFVMVIGMGTVFSFLTIMTFAMALNGKILNIINEYFPEEVPLDKKPVKQNVKNDDEIIAVAIAKAYAEANQSRI